MSISIVVIPVLHPGEELSGGIKKPGTVASRFASPDGTVDRIGTWHCEIWTVKVPLSSLFFMNNRAASGGPVWWDARLNHW